VTEITQLDADTTNAAAVRFRVSFSDPVAGLGAGNFTVPTTGGIVGAAVAGVVDDGDGRTWTVTVSTGTGDGTVGLSLTNTTGVTGPDGVSVQDKPISGPKYTIDKTAPVVAQFYVVYGNGHRYDLATATRLNLPWAITAVQVVFSEAVTGNASSLGLTGRNGVLGVSSFSGSGSATLTWTLASAITLDRVTVALLTQSANGIRDGAGNLLETVGTAFEVYVVLGDASGDRKVLTTDRALVRNLILAGGYNPFYDVNGDGVVDNADLTLVTGRVGTGLI
jgi:hypothetical protein